MAAEHDGSLSFDTELDNEGFEKGSQKMLDAIDGLTKQVEKMGTTMEKSFTALISTFQNAAAASKAQADAMAEAKEKSDSAAASQEKTARSATRAARSANRESAEVRALRAEMDKLDKQIIKEERNLEDYYREINTAHELAEDAVKLANSDTERERARETEAQQHEFINRKYEEQLRAIDRLENEKKALYEKIQRVKEAERQAAEQQEKERLAAEAAKKAAAEKAAAEKAAAKAKAEAEKKAAAEAAKKAAEEAAAQKAAEEAAKKEAEEKRKAAEESAKAAENTKQETDEIKKLREEYEKLQARIDKLKEDGDLGLRPDTKSAQTETPEGIAKRKEYLEAMKELVVLRARLTALERAAEEQSKQTGQTEKQAAEQAAQATQEQAQATQEKAAAQEETAQQATQAAAAEQAEAEQLHEEHQQAAEDIREVTEELKKEEKTHTSVFSRMCASVDQYLSNARKANLLSTKLVKKLTSLKTMLFARVKRMFISAIFSDMQEQLGSLRKYYTAYDNAMTRMKAATQRAGGSIAIAIAHLVVTAEPYITRLINLLTKGIEKLNNFISLLTGVKNIQVDEVTAYADAVEDADKAQKELNRDLFGFDQLNRQGGNEGTEETAKPTTTWTEVPTEESSFLDNLKKNLPEIEKLALGVGAALATWGIGNTILKLLGKNGAEAKLRLAGLALAIGGCVTYTMNFVDAWKNGVNNANINGMLGSAAVAAAGLGIAFKSLAAAGVGLAVGGFGMIVAGAKDWIKQGQLTNESFKSIELGIAGMGAGIALITGSWIPLLVAGVAAGGLAIYKNWDSIKQKLSKGWQDLKDDFSRPLGEIITVSDDVKMRWKVFSDSIVESWNNMKDKVRQGGAELKADWETIKTGASNFAAGVSNSYSVLKQSLADQGQQIRETFVNGWAELKTDFANIITFLQETWTNITIGIQSFISQIQLFLQEGWMSLQELWMTITIGLQEVWLGITTGVMDFITSVSLLWQEFQLFVQEIWTGITMFFSQAWENMKTSATTAAQTIKTFVTQAWTEVQATTNAVFSTVKTFLSTTFNTIKTSMTTAVQSAKTAVVAQWNALLASCTAIFNSVYTTIVTLIQQCAGFLAGQSWYGFGVQLMQGFWNGLQSLMASIWQSVVDFINRCVAAVRSALSIRSPSKVFEEIGEYTGEGFIIGLEGQQNAAVKTAENLADAVTDGMTGSLGMDLTTSGMSDIISSLGTVAGIFQTIAQTLSAIGGLSQPQIAAGTVVPYKARVNGLTTSEETSAAVATSLSDILLQLKDLVRNTAEGFSGTIVIPVTMDGHEILEVVVDENNRAIQRTGQSPIRV